MTAADRAAADSVYFDHNATTPLDPRVAEAMQPWLFGLHGNPSSTHRPGRAARAALEDARAEVAALLGAAPEDVVFTASGTEANNAVVFGLAASGAEPGHLVVSALEHPSVRRAADRLAAHGWVVDVVEPGADGVVSADDVEAALRPETVLVALMLANNELGTLQPVREVATRCREDGIPVLCDAVQAVGKLPVDVASLGVSYLSIGGHKFHGPLGAAALWIDPEAETPPSLLVGAPQEGARRAGTENVPAVVGLGQASLLARRELEDRRRHLQALRERFETGLDDVPDAIVHCAGSPRLPHTSHVAFPGLVGHALMTRLDEAGYAVSIGAACHSGRPQASAALLAMGMGEAEALASLRVSFGIENTAGEVDAFLPVLAREVAALRATA